ncbi:MAG: agmatine deiminase family protein [Bacteroidetes bacterium]|nr:agmatine deiminase family protein [Bacteroidota bacterium]
MKALLFRCCTLLFLALSIQLSAQQLDPNNGLKHWMTAEEASKRDLIGLSFVETDPPTGIIRNVEEFGPTESTLIRYPFGIPMSLIKEMAKDCKLVTIVANSSQQATVNSQYVSNGVNIANCSYLVAPTDSYWTRDYGPWYVTYGNLQTGIIDFPYNRPRPNDDEIPKRVAEMQGIEWFGMNVIHTGGNYMTDGLHQASSTTLVYDENPTQTAAQIAQKMHDYLGIDNYMVEADPNGTYIDHIDCWGKFLGPDKILIRKVPPTHPQYSQIEATAAFYASQISSYGTPYRVFRVNTPNDEPYTNSYIQNNKVFVPFMGTANDAGALLAYQQAMPGYQVTGYIASSAVWESTDALHCRTHEMSDRGMLYIEHTPLHGNLPAQPGFLINADITAYSQQQVYSDSVWVIYKVNSGTYDTVSMVNTGSNHYTGMIPGQMEGSTISYYIHAEDASGRNANHPFIGAADPHTFQVAVSAAPDVVVTPDTLFFNTFSDLTEGKTAYVRNYTAQNVLINYINSVNTSPYAWHIDPWNINLPYPVSSGDSLNLTVKFDLPAFPVAQLCDTLFITTPVSNHQVAICVNPDLLTGLNQVNPVFKGVTLSPNPVLTTTRFGYELPEKAHVKLDILSLNGSLISTIVNQVQEKGSYSVQWNPSDANGNPLPAGIYIYRLLTGNEVCTGKISLIR